MKFKTRSLRFSLVSFSAYRLYRCDRFGILKEAGIGSTESYFLSCLFILT